MAVVKQKGSTPNFTQVICVIINYIQKVFFYVSIAKKSALLLSAVKKLIEWSVKNNIQQSQTQLMIFCCYKVLTIKALNKLIKPLCLILFSVMALILG